MKIQEYNNNITQYNRVISINSLSKDVFSKNQNSEPSNSIHKEASNYSLPPFKRINNYITPYRLKISMGEVNDKKTINKETIEAIQKNNRIEDKKLEQSGNLAEKSGIKDKVVDLVNGNISQNYTM